MYKKSVFNHDNYDAYKKTNYDYASLVSSHASYGATIWIHDFHLSLVPGILADIRPDLKVGFFSHIPSAQANTWKQIPEARELLQSLSKCRAIGFNTNRARTNLLLTFKMFKIPAPSTYTMPIGVSRQPVISVNNLSDKVRIFTENVEKLKDQYDLQIILSVDRADCSKGHKTRIAAIELLINNHPTIAKKLLFVSICPPSRTDVSEEYKELYEYLFGKPQVFNGAIAKLNKLARLNLAINYDLIQVIPESIPGVEIQYLREICDVYLVTSRADGLHLGLVETLSAKLSKKLRDLNAIISTGAGISEYFTAEDGAEVYNPNQLNSHEQLVRCIINLIQASQVEKLEKAEQLAYRFEVLGFDMQEWIQKARESIVLSYNTRKSSNHFLYREHMLYRKTIESKSQLNIILDIDAVLCVEHPEKPIDVPYTYKNTAIVTADFRNGSITTNTYNLLAGAEAFIAFLINNDFNLKFFSAGSKIRNESFIQILFDRIRESCRGGKEIETLDLETSVFSAHHRMPAPNDITGVMRKNLLTALNNDQTLLQNTIFIDDLPTNVYPDQEACYLNVPGCFHLAPEHKKHACPDMFEQKDLIQRCLQLYFVTAVLFIVRQNYLRAETYQSLNYFLAKFKANIHELRNEYKFYEIGFKLLSEFDPNLILPTEHEFYQSNFLRPRVY